jgi:hypothetical protein
MPDKDGNETADEAKLREMVRREEERRAREKREKGQE